MTTFRPVPKPEPRPKRGKLPLPKVNPVRAAKRYERDYGDKGEWIRTLACCCTGKRTGEWVIDPELGRVLVRVVAGHFPGRGAGGRSADLVPIALHLEIRGHQNLKRLETQQCVRFKDLAKLYEERWQRREARRLSGTVASQK